MDIINNLDDVITSVNLVKNFDEEVLRLLGDKLVTQFEEDSDSRTEWLSRTNAWLKLATQVVEKKSFPWPDAANVKYPLLTTAAMQFSARAYPALVPGSNLVSAQVTGMDQNGQKYQRSKRIQAHMSWQILNQMDNWEEDMDKLSMILPIIGTCFKKTYYDNDSKKNCSHLVLPQDLVVHYYAKSIDEATRKFHLLSFTQNELYEKVVSGEFIDLDFDDIVSNKDSTEFNKTKDVISGRQEPQEDEDTPQDFLEAHVWADLDEDDYKEPWVITIHKNTRKIVRIVARFTSEGVKMIGDKIAKITPIEYFTKFGFIPNPDGSIYDLGFGILLGGINETVNTLTNQLLDSGTLSNLQAGFLGRGIRIRGGAAKFSPGEWKSAEFTGDDIRKHIFPLPTREPSNVLFTLLETLVTSGKELASIAEIMVGKMPGQNTPATTTMASIEQGEKVFTAIYKRIWRALGKEYSKLYHLNRLFLDDSANYFTINQPSGPEGQVIYKQDYSLDISVKPAADPNAASKASRMMRRQAESGLLQLGTINPQVFTKRFLEDLEEENIEELMTLPPPPPSPEDKKLMQKEQSEIRQTALDQQESDINAALAAKQLELKEKELELKDKEIQIKELQLKVDAAIASAQIHAGIADSLTKAETAKEKKTNEGNSQE